MSGVQAVLHSTTLHNLMLPPTAGRTLTEPRLNRLNSESRLPPAARGVEGKLCLLGLGKELAAVGVVGTVNRRFKVLWKNRSLVFPQNRQFPQRFSPAHLVYAAGK